MLSINKIYCWLFVFALLIQIPSIHLLKFLDELLVVFMMCLVFLDVVVNKQFKKYNMLWLVTGIMLFYAIYSLTWVSYNTSKAIFQDFVVQMKPFCYFCISYAVVPQFSKNMKVVIKWICLFNVFMVVFCFIAGLTKSIFHIVTYYGLVSMISALAYLFCSVDNNNKVSKKDIIVVVIMLLIGLISTRSKYYGEFVIALYLLFFYAPGLMKNIKLKHVLVLALMLIVVLVVAWGKIDYYFISGGQEYQMFDEDMLASFARPVLYAGMFMLLGLHPLFGSGLASFATFASTTAVNYSRVYATIGIDNVWGLSEDFDLFICDAFYPELAQFGIVGVVLFICFFVWMNKKISLLLYTSGKMLYVIGIASIVVLLIESIASTTFNQGAGALCMMVLGCLASKNKNITKQQETEIRKMPYKERSALEYIKK